MLTWSLGWMVFSIDIRSPPAISIARLLITSLTFMLLLVPLPVWKTSIGNSPPSFPSITSSAAASIASTCASLSGFLPLPVNLPRSRLAIPQACLTIPIALIIVPGSCQPLIGKFSTAR